jgi:hypothetical protein
MKTRIIWFVAGIMVSWLAWSMIAAVRTRPRDYTADWAAPMKQTLPDSISWLKHARGVELGQYSVFVPTAESNASLYVYYRNRHFPGVIISDARTNGIPSDFLVADAQTKTVSLTDKDGDGAFDSYSISTGVRSDSLDLADNNFDGTFDMRLSPLRAPYINIADKWYALIRTNQGQYVEVGGRLRGVKTNDGIWGFADSE